MRRSIIQITIVSTLLASLSACQSPQPTQTPVAAKPPILSSLSVKGRGAPFGRSDSTAPFLQSIVLPMASEADYGLSQHKPILTGPKEDQLHIPFLNSLRGPKGEPVEYEREGSCCPFEDTSLPFGGGLLDVYRVRIDGFPSPITLYVNMYHAGTPQIPKGFTQRQ